MNVVFHMGATVALFLALLEMTGAMWRSALVAALFACHPLHVESVAWVSERKDVLSGLFWMLAMVMYGRYVKHRAGPSASVKTAFTSREYWLCVLCFALGLLSKSMVVTLPFVLLLLDSWPLRRWRLDSLREWRTQLPRLALEKTPLFVLSTFFCVTTFVAQKAADVVQSTIHYPLAGRIENTFVAYSGYLQKTFWPVNLAVLYPHPGHWPLPIFVASLLTIVAVSVTVWRWGNRFPFLLLGWLWFLGTLVPVIGLVQVGMQSMADRYTYLPLVGVFIMLSWGATELVGRWKLPWMGTAAAAVLVLTACAARTRDQLGYWQNGGTIFQHTVTVTRGNDRAYVSLGRYHAINGNLPQAVACYRAAIQINPDCRNAYINLGTALERLHQPGEALQAYQEALRIDPAYVATRFDLACLLVGPGRRDEAIEQLRTALRYNPDFKLAQMALNQLGVSIPSQPSQTATQ